MTILNYKINKVRQKRTKLGQGKALGYCVRGLCIKFYLYYDASSARVTGSPSRLVIAFVGHFSVQMPHCVHFS